MQPDEYERQIKEICKQLTNIPELRKAGTIIKVGKRNTWEGASEQRHQIDVSLSTEANVLLIECKEWNSPIKVAVVLALLGLLYDIEGNECNKHKKIRGAICATKGAQRGAKKLLTYYAEKISFFCVKDTGEIGEIIHRHFIKVPSITNG